MAALLWLVAAVCLGYALQLGNGHLHADAILPLKWMLGCAALAILVPAGWCWSATTETLTVTLLCAALTYQLGQLLVVLPGIYLQDSSDQALLTFRSGIVAAALLCGLIAARPRSNERWYQPALALLALYFALGLWLLFASPKPFIDTYVFQRHAVRSLLAGVNPYTITFPNIYNDETMYGRGLVANGRLNFGYVYPPLSLFLALPGACLGDVRFSQLVATTLSAGCMIASAAGHRIAVLAAALFLFTPRGFFVLEQSWTEPYLVCLTSIVVWSAVRAPRLLPFAIGCMLVVKQYMVLLLPLVWLLPNVPRAARPLCRFGLRIAASAALVTLPLALWNPQAFYRSALILQFQQPFRPDALSFPAIRLAAHELPLPSQTPFVLAACAIGLALWRAPRTAAGFAGAAALVFALFFAFAKQAFCNYYYFVIGLLCCAIAATRAAGPPHPQQIAP